MRHFVITCLLLFAANLLSAQTKQTTQIKVWGNCSMCKTTIEKAARAKGVMFAEWNQSNHLLTVTYQTNKISIQQIQQNIAAAGYDTAEATAPDDKYALLPECCQYDRKNGKKGKKSAH